MTLPGTIKTHSPKDTELLILLPNSQITALLYIVSLLQPLRILPPENMAPLTYLAATEASHAGLHLHACHPFLLLNAAAACMPSVHRGPRGGLRQVSAVPRIPLLTFFPFFSILFFFLLLLLLQTVFSQLLPPL